jgi:hypothetical protein
MKMTTETQKSGYRAHSAPKHKADDSHAIAKAAERKGATDHDILMARNLAFRSLNREVQLELSRSKHRDIRLFVMLNLNVFVSVVKSAKHRPEYLEDQQMMEHLARAESLCEYRSKRLAGLIRADPAHRELLGLQNEEHHDDHHMDHMHIEEHHLPEAHKMLRQEMKIPTNLIAPGATLKTLRTS